MMIEKELSCGAIIIDENKILMIEQNNDLISFPKGHQEKGESKKETAIRETKEETNLDIKIISEKEYTVSYLVKENIPKDAVFYLAKTTNKKELKPSREEIRNAFWVPIEGVKELINKESIKIMWDEVLKDIVKNKTK